MSGLFVRLAGGGGSEISFTVDGERCAARAGDTVLTALLLDRVFVRRFEFGAGYRAGFCLMGACQDCWLALADGRRVRACTTLVEPGMAVVIEDRDG